MIDLRTNGYILIKKLLWHSLGDKKMDFYFLASFVYIFQVVLDYAMDNPQLAQYKQVATEMEIAIRCYLITNDIAALTRQWNYWIKYLPECERGSTTI